MILYEETLNQSASDGTPFPVLLQKRGIVVGIKVDKVPSSPFPLSLAHTQQLVAYEQQPVTDFRVRCVGSG